MPFDIIRIRRDTFANWQSVNPTLALGEISYDLTNSQIRVGDGTLTWLNLPVVGTSAVSNGDKGDIIVSNNGTTWTLDPALLNTINNKLDQGPLDGGTASTPDQVMQIRRGTTVSWNNVILGAGEIGYDSEVNEIRIGNGISTWDNLDPIGFFKVQNINLQQLGDVDYPNPLLDGQVLTYDISGNWVNETIPAPVLNINALTDVTISAPENTQILQYNGTQWVNSPLPTTTGIPLTTGNKGDITVVSGTDFQINNDTITQANLNLSYPVNPQDAATKDYTDQTIGLALTANVTDELDQANGIAVLNANRRVEPIRLGSGTPNNTNFLRGDGSWQPTSAPSIGFNDLSDVTITSPSPTDLIYLNPSLQWVNVSLSTIAASHGHALSQITLVPQQQQPGRIVWWNSDQTTLRTATLSGTGLASVSWDNTTNTITVNADANHTHPTSSIINLDTTLSTLTNELNNKAPLSHTHNLTQITNSGASVGNVPVWTETGWVPQAPPSGVTDHGALTGLGDNDHPQYLLVTDAATTYAPVSNTHVLANITNAGTLAAQNANNVAITGGSVQNVNLITGAFTSPLGETVMKKVFNNTLAPIQKGQVVYITGSQGDNLTVALADADLESTAATTIGVAAEQINVGISGYIITQGPLTGLNGITTPTYSNGAALWLSSTPGAFTTTRPTQPAHGVFIGWVISTNNGNAGRIYVKIANGQELNELHDVLISTPKANNDVLAWDSSTNLWKNKTLTNAGIASTAPKYIIADSTNTGNLPSYQALGDLTTGILKSTVAFGNGTLSIATGSDLPTHTHTIANITDLQTTLDNKAPKAATYIVQSADTTLTNEQSLGALTTGILKNTVTSGVGVLSVAGGADLPTHTHDVGAITGLGALATLNSVGTTQIDNLAVTGAKIAASTIPFRNKVIAPASGNTLYITSTANTWTEKTFSSEFDLTNASTISLGSISGTKVTNASLTVNKINATGTANSNTYLRGDGQWAGILVSNVENLQGALDQKLDNNKTTAYTLSLLEEASALGVRSNLELGTLSTKSSISALTDISEFDISSPALNQVLMYSGTKWVNQNQSNITDGGNY